MISLRPRTPALRSRWVPSALLPAAALVLTGCGAPAGTVDRATFAHRVCSAIVAFETKVGTDATAVSTRIGGKTQPPAVVRAQVSGLLGDMVSLSATLGQALAAAGRPPGRGNQRFAAALDTAAAAVQGSLAEQQQKVAAASSTDANALNATVSTALDAVQAADTTLTDGYNEGGNYADIAINNAFAAEDSCSDL